MCVHTYTYILIYNCFIIDLAYCFIDYAYNDSQYIYKVHKE